ncbi:hypothetical protein WDU94_003498 [Cyamophila willieti]
MPKKGSPPNPTNNPPIRTGTPMTSKTDLQSYHTRTNRKLDFQKMQDNPEAKFRQSTKGSRKSAWSSSESLNSEIDMTKQQDKDDPEATLTYNVNIRNSFEVLNNEDENNSTHDDTAYHIPRKNATKPIYIQNYGESTDQMAKRVKAVCKKPYTMKYLGKNISVKTTSTEDHQALLTFLKDSSIQYHTFTLPETKDVMAVLKGLPPDYTTEEILEEIKIQIQSVKQVIKMKTKAQDVYPIFLVKFNPSTNFQEILKANHLLYIRVYWEKYRTSRATQCFNCQRFGHGSRNCNHSPKCLKCGLDHSTRSCQKTRDDKPNCANCGGEHLASDRNCIVLKKYNDKINKIERTKMSTKNRDPQKLTRSNDTTEFPLLHAKQRPTTSWTDPPSTPKTDNRQLQKLKNELLSSLSYTLMINENNVKITRRQKLNILTWNARGLKSKLSELMFLIQNKGIDIACIQETKLTSETKLFVENYTIIRKDRIKLQNKYIGNGLAIIIRKEINYKRITTVNTNTEKLESLGIQIKNNHNNPINIFSIHATAAKLNFPDLDLLSNNDTPTIIAGDFNAKHRTWDPVQENQNGKKLAKYADKRNVTIYAPEEPTRIPDRRSDPPAIIDLFVTKGITNVNEVTTLNDLGSDHNPVLLELNHHHDSASTLHYNYEAADWDKFSNHLCQYKPTYNDIPIPIHGIEEEIMELTKTIKESMDRAIPKKATKPKSIQLTERIKTLMNLRNRARVRWQKYRNLEYKSVINKLSRRIQYEIQVLKNKLVDDEIKKLSTRDNTLWKNIKKFKSQATKIDYLTASNQRTETNQEITEALATNYENVHKTTKEIRDPHTDLEVAQSIRHLENTNGDENEYEDLYTTKNELKTIIKDVKNKKAPGEDNIQGIILKKVPDNILEVLVDVLNSSIRWNHFPKTWKNGIIIPIKKPKKDPHLPSSYRPISLLPILGKIFEKVILTRIQKTDKLLQNEQFAFRKGHSTCHQLTRVVQDIATNMTRKIPTTMVLLDIEKAFDCVWHDGLIHKLKKTGINTILVKIIASYLTDRTFQVRYLNKLSSKRMIDAGVPQGSILGPTLFAMYIADLPTTPGTKTALFADDTAIYISGKPNSRAGLILQAHLDKLEKYYRSWKIKINATKTEGIIFSNRNHIKMTNYKKELKFQNAEITWKKEVKYLGCVLDSKLTWRKHIDYATSKAISGIHVLFKLINKKSKLDPKLKTLLYKVMIVPVLTYATPTWLSAAPTNMVKLQKVQNRYLRIIHNDQLTKYKTTKLHELSNITPIHEVQKQLNLNFYTKIQGAENPLVKKLGTFTPFNTGGKYNNKLPTIPEQYAMNLTTYEQIQKDLFQQARQQLEQLEPD